MDGTNRLLDAAREIQGFCQSRHWRFCFIGGIAVQHWGEARLTRDADLTVFTGFGGEEGYIHEKFRQAGRKCFCMPWLKWVHRFNRPHGMSYPVRIEDKLYNYVIGHAELGLDIAPVVEHFSEFVPREQVMQVVKEALGPVVQTGTPTPAALP